MFVVNNYGAFPTVQPTYSDICPWFYRVKLRSDVTGHCFFVELSVFLLPVHLTCALQLLPDFHRIGGRVVQQALVEPPATRNLDGGFSMDPFNCSASNADSEH